MSALDHYSTARLQCIRDDALHTGDTDLADICEEIISAREAAERAATPDPLSVISSDGDSEKSAGNCQVLK